LNTNIAFIITIATGGDDFGRALSYSKATDAIDCVYDLFVGLD
jgi:hypothetical protein